jgi:hypothetical protein
MEKQRISIGERLTAGFLFALMVGITALCVPIGLLIVSRGRALNVLHVFSGFHVWATGLLIFSGLLGMALGPDRSMEMLGHLWGTERPRRIGLTLAIWSGFILIALCSYWIFKLPPSAQ